MLDKGSIVNYRVDANYNESNFMKRFRFPNKLPTFKNVTQDKKVTKNYSK